jgi:hypothetical protein
MAQTHDVPSFSKAWSHLEVESAAEARGVFQLIRAYQDELTRSGTSDGALTLRTATLREPSGQDKLTIWYQKPGSYQLRLGVPGLVVSISESDMERIETWCLRFFEGKREALFKELMTHPTASVAASFPSLLNALTRPKS